MGPTEWLVVAGVLAFAGASFFFAVAESALFALGKFRAREIAGQPGGATVLRLLEQPAELLATVSLGNTAANAAIVALVLWPVLLGQWRAEVTLPAVALFILLGCVVAPGGGTDVIGARDDGMASAILPTVQRDVIAGAGAHGVAAGGVPCGCGVSGAG